MCAIINNNDHNSVQFFQGSMVVYAMWNLEEQVKRKSSTVISTVIPFIITLSGFQCLAADIQCHRMLTETLGFRQSEMFYHPEWTYLECECVEYSLINVSCWFSALTIKGNCFPCLSWSWILSCCLSARRVTSSKGEKLQNSRCCCLCSWDLYFFSICVHKWDKIFWVKNKVRLKLNAWVQLWLWDLFTLLSLLLFCLFLFWHWRKNSLFALYAPFLWCCRVKRRWRQEVISSWLKNIVYDTIGNSKVFDILNTQLCHDHRAVMLHLGFYQERI